MLKWYKYGVQYIGQDLIHQQSYLSQDAAFGADCFTPFRILKNIIVSLKMDSGNAIENCYML